jgi:cephalosporin hydroxylase
MTINSDADIIRACHQLYYARKEQTWGNTYWLGVSVQKCPPDLWIYQEIIYETRPDLIIECGTARGGSALYLASICELLGCGQVVTIDVIPQPGRLQHPRITYLTGSSTSSEIIEQVRALAAGATKVMVVLDSDHHKDHVLQEMRIYSSLVSVGCYLIVEDTILNGHPVVPDFGPGPWEAVEEFLRENHDFEIDKRREKFMLTANPNGYLKRIK